MRTPSRSGLEALEQSGERYFQSIGNSQEMPDGGIPNALLNAPHVRAMHARLVGQVLLRPPLRLSELSNPLAERLLDGVCAFRHGHMLSWSALQID